MLISTPVIMACWWHPLRRPNCYHHSIIMLFVTDDTVPNNDSFGKESLIFIMRMRLSDHVLSNFSRSNFSSLLSFSPASGQQPFVMANMPPPEFHQNVGTFITCEKSLAIFL